MTPCPRCEQATTDGLLCDVCVSLWRRTLKDLAKYLPELTVNYTRFDQTSRGTVHGLDRSLELAAVEAAEQRMIPAHLRSRHEVHRPLPHALPLDPAAGELLTKALRLLGEVAAGVEAPGLTPAVLRNREPISALRRHEQAAVWVDRLRSLARTIETAIDRREPDLYLGRCDTPDVTAELADDGTLTVDVETICGADLYAKLGDSEIECSACGWVYPVAEQRERMLTVVRDLLARPKQIADALTSLDLPINAGTLDVWISRDKRLHQQGRSRPDGLPLILADPVTDENGKPLYRVGDVVDRVEAMRARAEVVTPRSVLV